MTTYYVGIGGNDANSGLNWANRKATLTGAEDIPVAGGDTVYVGPGVYREQLTVDVSGSSGSPVTYIADVTGQNTDGVGGIVRITGSNDDQTATRASCITGTGKNYRTFTGFAFDLTTGTMVNLAGGCTDWTVQDCFFSSSAGQPLTIAGAGGTHIIRRCIFFAVYRNTFAITISHTTTYDNSGNLVENCIFTGTYGRGLNTDRVGGIAVKNCTFVGLFLGTRVTTALAAGQTLTLNNCIFQACNTALQGTASGEVVEDFNTFFDNATDRSTVNTGANSVAYPALFLPPALFSGIALPWQFGALSQWSQVREIAGNSVSADDLFGLLRPTLGLYGWVDSSWGAIQYQDVARATNNVRTGTASMVMADSARHQIFVPVAAEQTTFSVYVYREASYIGNNPQMVIKQPGQPNRFAIDVGPAGDWNNLSITFVPAASPPYVVVELVSENQQENSLYGGNYDVYWDDLTVT